MLGIEYTAISDDPVLGIKRAVMWQSFAVLKYQKLIQLTTTTHYFTADGNQQDNYGPEIKTQGLKPFEKTFYASNERKVNPLNGKECKIQSVILGQNPDGSQIRENQWIDSQGNQVLNPTGQFDYFMWIVRNYPVIIENLIRSIIIEEDEHYQSFNN
jgi:hypothetical protein